jgi:hypothetical protein
MSYSVFISIRHYKCPHAGCDFQDSDGTKTQAHAKKCTFKPANNKKSAVDHPMEADPDDTILGTCFFVKFFFVYNVLLLPIIIV